MSKFLCQARDIFEIFADNFKLTQDTLNNKSLFSIIALGDFNAKPTELCKSDTNIFEG